MEQTITQMHIRKGGWNGCFSRGRDKKISNSASIKYMIYFSSTRRTKNLEGPVFEIFQVFIYLRNCIFFTLLVHNTWIRPSGVYLPDPPNKLTTTFYFFTVGQMTDLEEIKKLSPRKYLVLETCSERSHMLDSIEMSKNWILKSSGVFKFGFLLMQDFVLKAWFRICSAAFDWKWKKGAKKVFSGARAT